MQTLAPGSEIDGFRIEAVLHSGSNGIVYAVTGRDAAPAALPMVMKVPITATGQIAMSLVSFETESQVMRLLTGPYVPRFVAAGDIASTPYLVMERIDGESLESIMHRAPLPPPDVARIGAALADALHSVHLQDVQHHDVKPENFVLRPSGQAVLLDFGYARHARYPDLLAEELHFAAGSAPYVSPEQLAGIRGDPRSDLFALGALLYELACGEPPFGTPVTIAGLRDRLWRAPVPPRARMPDFPPWLQEVILHLLEVDADRRYENAAHVAFDLRHPEQVQLTRRAMRVHALGFAGQLRRWWRRGPRGVRDTRVAPRVPAPVIMVGVDTEHPDDDRLPALQSATRQLIAGSPEYRLMCVAVVRVPIADPARDADAPNRHVEHSIRLNHWAAPLGLSAVRQSLHVVEAADPAATLLELARANHVDIIVLGAPRPGDKTLGWWRSIASRVTAQASCSVHLARVPLRDEATVDPRQRA